MLITLLPLPSLSPPTPLTQAKAAFSFAVYSSIQNISPSDAASPSATDKLDQPNTKPIPTLVTYLLVGCRRKAVLYTWKDGEAQGVKVRSSGTAHEICKLTFCPRKLLYPILHALSRS